MGIKEGRILVINKEFTLPMSGDICVEIYKLSKESKEDITIIINSTGGNIRALDSIVSALKGSGCNINTVLIGTIACSCGAQLFLSGDERIMLNGSELLIHEPGITFKDGTRYSCTQLKKKLKELKEDKANFLDCILKVSNCNKKFINSKIKNKDWYINAKEAFKFGLATKIIYSFDEINAEKIGEKDEQ